MFFEVYADKEVDELISLLYSASARTAYQTHTILSSSAEEKEKPQVRERTSRSFKFMLEYLNTEVPRCTRYDLASLRNLGRGSVRNTPLFLFA